MSLAAVNSLPLIVAGSAFILATVKELCVCCNKKATRAHYFWTKIAIGVIALDVITATASCWWIEHPAFLWCIAAATLIKISVPTGPEPCKIWHIIALSVSLAARWAAFVLSTAAISKLTPISPQFLPVVAPIGESLIAISTLVATWESAKYASRKTLKTTMNTAETTPLTRVGTEKENA